MTDAADRDTRDLRLSRREATAVYEGMAAVQAFLARRTLAAKVRDWPYSFDDCERVKREVERVFGGKP